MFDYNAPEHVAERARQAAMRPGTEKLCAQYVRGLMTTEELISALCEISTQTVTPTQDNDYGWCQHAGCTQPLTTGGTDYCPSHVREHDPFASNFN